MTTARRSRVLALLLGLAACERAKQAPPTDTLTAQQLAAADSAKALATGHSWDRSAGPVLLVAADAPARAFVLVPDSANAEQALAALPHPASVTLFGRNGTVQTAELPAVTNDDVCLVATLNAAPPPRPWSVGFLGGVVSPLGMDSTSSFGRADSAEAVTGVTRLASALPNDTAGRFAGLPFTVRALWRFAPPDGPLVIAAILVRQIAQEAMPLQEQTLILGERAPGDTTLNVAYSERSYGDEETIENRELLAAALFGPTRTPGIIVVHDFGSSTSYSLVEREANGQWRARWVSARRRC